MQIHLALDNDCEVHRCVDLGVLNSLHSALND